MYLTTSISRQYKNDPYFLEIKILDGLYRFPFKSYNRPFNIPFLRDDFDGGLVFGRGGGLFSPGFGFVINPPLVDEADRGKEDVAELVVELVSLFASPFVGLNK